MLRPDEDELSESIMAERVFDENMLSSKLDLGDLVRRIQKSFEVKNKKDWLKTSNKISFLF